MTPAETIPAPDDLTVQIVTWLAGRVRAGQPIDLWDSHVDAVRTAWRYPEHRADAQVVIDKFPGLFPLLGGRACE